MKQTAALLYIKVSGGSSINSAAVVTHMIGPERISKKCFKKKAVVSGILRVIWGIKLNYKRMVFLRRLNFIKYSVQFFFLLYWVVSFWK